MTVVVAKFRSPLPPHQVLGESRVKNLRYGFSVDRQAQASFEISRNDSNAATTLRSGMMLTLERGDGYLPWAGFITRRSPSLKNPIVPFLAKDHYGALFTKGRTAKNWEELTLSSGIVIKRIFEEADVRGDPPLLVDLGQCVGGPVVAYTPKAEPLSQFLSTMGNLGWEWSLKSQITQKNVVTDLCWQERIGRDLSSQISFSENKHFLDATLVDDTKGRVTAALAVGGSGAFRDRLASEVNMEGRASPGIDGHRALGVTVPLSPVLAGTRVAIEPAITNLDALTEIARNLQRSTSDEFESLTFDLAESELDMSTLELGSVYLLRFQNLDLGLGLERRVRFKAFSLGEQGVVNVVGEVLSAVTVA